MVKMRKLGKRRSLFANWEGPYAFVKYKDEKGCRKFDDDNQICIIKGLMASNGNVLGMTCKCSTKSKICVDTYTTRKEVSHV
jgi:hypothetical protein